MAQTRCGWPSNALRASSANGAGGLCRPSGPNPSGPASATGALTRSASRRPDVGSGRQLQVSLAAAVVVLDQVVKGLVRSRLELFDSTTVIPGVLSLTRVHNSGAAFGLLNATSFPYK